MTKGAMVVVNQLEIIVFIASLHMKKVFTVSCYTNRRLNGNKLITSHFEGVYRLSKQTVSKSFLKNYLPWFLEKGS